MKYLLFFSLLLLAGCQDFFDQVVEVDIPEHQPQLAISAQWDAGDTLWQVFVSRSAGILDSTDLYSAYVEDAQVILERNGQPWQTLGHAGNGFYEAALDSFPAVPNDSYTLRVSAPGFEGTEAVQVMPRPAEILEASYTIDGGISPEGDTVNTLDIRFRDPGGAEDYYEFRVWYVNDYTSYPIYLQTEDLLVEYFQGRPLLADGPFDGKEYTFRAWTYEEAHLDPNGRLIMQVISIARDRYLFLRSLEIYNQVQDNPFAEPILVHDNIGNGVGIFSLGAVSEVVVGF